VNSTHAAISIQLAVPLNLPPQTQAFTPRTDAAENARAAPANEFASILLILPLSAYFNFEVAIGTTRR
jgi:hypothetical protein